MPSICIKSGHINLIVFNSNEEICVFRPQHLNSIFIKPELVKNIHENHCNNSILDNNFSVDFTFGYLDSDKPSIFQFMPRKIEALTWKQKFKIYGKLGKLRLTSLVMTSAISGSLMTPESFDLQTIIMISSGIFFTSMAANAINQILEVPYDSQMNRTKNRPLVLGKISPLHASIFALISAISGSILLFICNPLTCGLGLTNLVLYTVFYTPFKRSSVINTWFGSIVGGIPPLIGWAGITGGIDQGGILISTMLFCWQFPHFMALSWNLKSDYSLAGYQMASIIAPEICRKSALRHSILISALCPLTSAIKLTDWWFVLEILPFNIALCILGYRFYFQPTSSSSRNLFRYTLVYLPILMTLLILNKLYNTHENIQ